IPLVLVAQDQTKTKAPPSNVDKLVAVMDSMTMASFDNWKCSPDLHSGELPGDPRQIVYDDSKWETITIGQNLKIDSCWMRKEITIPSMILGKPVSGSFKFLVSVDDYGYLWVNGESKGYFPWDGEFELTKDAKPGQKFELVIRAINTGGPLRLLRAQIQSENLKEVRQLIDDYSLSLRAAQKLLSFDTYQTNAFKREDPGIDKSKMDKAEKTKLNAQLQDAAASLDLSTLANGSYDQFKASLAAMTDKLKAVSAYAKKYTLYFDSNAHIDAAWLWRDLETVEVVHNTFGSVLKMMDERPDFTYTQSAAAYYDWMEQKYPEVFKGIQQRVKDGRWEVVGGMWVEPDCNLPGGESWMRHLLYSKRYFKQKLGANVTIGWNPDSFGYNWDMPEFYQQAGIDAFVTQKMGWSEQNVFPYRVFWWQSPDSSRVLCYFPFDYVNDISDPYQFIDWLRQFEANTGFSKFMVLFGVGDHGGGPSDEMLAKIDRLKNLDFYPTIEYGNTANYLTWLKSQDLKTLPVWNDEVYLEYHQGTYTTQAKMKEWTRKSEVALTNAEKFSSIASLDGIPYSNADFEEAWRKVLFNQFHDVLPGSGIRENYIDATEKFQQAKTITDYRLTIALKDLSHQVNTSAFKKGASIVVYNSLGWERSDIVCYAMQEGDARKYIVFDAKGNEIPSQIYQIDKYTRGVMFRADHVPALGYKTYELRVGNPSQIGSPLIATDSTLENQFFKVRMDKDSGWVKSIVDKRNGKELLYGYGNELQLLEDNPKAWSAWNIGLTGVKYPWKFHKFEVVENGQVRIVLRGYLDYLKPGTKKDYPTFYYPNTFATQDIILYDGIDRIDFKSDIDWWEDKTMMKVAFPVTVVDTAATYEIPYGTIRRSTKMDNRWEKAKVEVPAEKWADLSDGTYGVSLLNRSKYGYDIKGSLMRLSLLRSPDWPDPTADRGKHSIEYSLYPHNGTWREAQTVRMGYQYNTPLIAYSTDAHKGKQTGEHSFVSLEPSNLILTVVKKAEDSNAWVLQWYDSEGKTTDATLTLPQTVKKAVMSNFLEEDGAPLTASGNTVKAKTKSHGVVTVKVWF
ncbi:MAG TPA: glycoside hydrolase family 38 C-terminal domain-containing protein, partial [Bacteroidota bacterium]|nr:glycoside hydrolase family 38 C-terminal domain-containing protein [Bacteroidota bacterium]